MTEWLWAIRCITVVVFLICLMGSIRAANYVGRIARKANRPISKSTMLGLLILLFGALAAMVLSFIGRAPANEYTAILAIIRHLLWASLAIKTIITDEIIIRRPERMFTYEEQCRIAAKYEVSRDKVDGILREFLR